MRIEWVVLLAVLACHAGPPGAQAAGPDARGASPPAAPPPAPAKVESYYEEGELRGLAAQAKPLKKKNQLLVCGEAAGKNCVCVEPLPCQSEGKCITFQENVAAF